MSDNSTEDGNASSPDPNEEPQIRLASAHNTPPNAVGESDEITLSDDGEGKSASRDLLDA